MTQAFDGFIRRAEEVLSQIDGYVESGATDIAFNDLQVVRQKIGNMILCAKSMNLPKNNIRHPELSRMIVDQWPLGSSLGNIISVLEREYISL